MPRRHGVERRTESEGPLGRQKVAVAPGSRHHEKVTWDQAEISLVGVRCMNEVTSFMITMSTDGMERDGLSVPRLSEEHANMPFNFESRMKDVAYRETLRPSIRTRPNLTQGHTTLHRFCCPEYC
jgi:hypothetical protein